MTSLKVFDMLGKEVAILVDRQLEQGTHHIEFDSGNAPSGIYYYMLKSSHFQEIKRMVILK